MVWCVLCSMAGCSLCYGIVLVCSMCYGMLCPLGCVAWYVHCAMAWFWFESNDSPLPCHNHRPACPNNTLTPEMKMKGMTNILIINDANSVTAKM